ncbi:MAG: WYL domain-containing protein [Actinomycetota bacterium]
MIAMRADRLLSILLLLQANGRMSAGTLARRLEVSRRTIYRDVEALGAAGVPVVVDQGREGGVSLLAGWRTDVTGLTEAELSALLAFASSGPASDLGLEEDLSRAARKGAAAATGELPRPGVRFQDRVLIDNNPWAAPRRVPAHLARIQDALWSDRRLALHYRKGDGSLTDRVVEPYGLIAKNGVWYLLAAGETGLRTYRVSRVESAVVTEDRFARPEGFDLERAWANHTRALRPPEPLYVTVRANPVQAAQFLRFAASHIVAREAASRGGPGGTQAGSLGGAAADPDIVLLEFPAAGAAAAFIASFGSMIEVLDPPAVRARLAAMGRELLECYSPRTPPP